MKRKIAMVECEKHGKNFNKKFPLVEITVCGRCEYCTLRNSDGVVECTFDERGKS